MRYSVKLSLLAAVVAVSATVGGVYTYAKKATSNPPISTTTIASPKAKATSSTGGSDTNGAVKGVATLLPASPVPACTPGITTTLPATPIVSVANPGLHESPMTVSEYTIFGNTLNQLRDQASSCAPIMPDGNRYSANTSYSISWTFNLSLTDNNLCVVKNASVGLSLTQQYPSWQAGPNAATGLASAWQSYKDDLVLHEMGHADLARSYAATILGHIQSFPATDCSTIATAVNNLAQSDLDALNAANDGYDSSTDHGVTQGAIL